MMDEMRDRYLHNMQVRNYSKDTIATHARGLGRFYGYLTSIGIIDLSAVGRKTIGDYQDHLFTLVNKKGQVNSPVTRNHDLAVVKSFFRYLHANEHVTQDPAQHVTFARTDQPLPKNILNHGEMRKLVYAPDLTTPLGMRDAAWLHLAYSAAMRKGEMMNLLLQDLDTVNGWARVNQSKTRTSRIVPVGKIACRYLDHYLRDARPRLVKDTAEQHLFVSAHGNPLERTTPGIIVKRHARNAKLKTRVTPHGIRHSAATALVRRKANIRHVQELLGHTLLTSTQVYTRMAPQDLKEALERHHPMEHEYRHDVKQGGNAETFEG